MTSEAVSLFDHLIYDVRIEKREGESERNTQIPKTIRKSMKQTEHHEHMNYVDFVFVKIYLLCAAFLH